MVILGNLVAESYGLNTKSNVIDVIVSKGDVKKAKKQFRIFNGPTNTTKYGKIYSTPKGRFMFYDANRLPILNEIYNSSFSHRQLTFAPPIYMYAWATNKARLLHADTNLEEWERSVAIHNHLRMEYFGRHIVADYEKKLGRITADMVTMNFERPDYKPEGYVYKPFDVYRREDLFELFASEHREKSLYEGILIAPKANFRHMRDMASYMKWCKYTHTEKLDAIVERLYVDVCNEFLIDEMTQGWTAKTFSFSLREMVTLAFMYAITDVDHVWLSRFILENYEDIWKRIDLNALDLLYEATQSNYLTKIQ